MYKTASHEGNSVKIIEDETGNTVAWMRPSPNGWWAWSWEDGSAILRSDFQGKTLEEVMTEAEDWL